MHEGLCKSFEPIVFDLDNTSGFLLKSGKLVILFTDGKLGIIKGTVPQDFCLRLFFIKYRPPTPEYKFEFTETLKFEADPWGQA
jgi:hypothetical protein